MADDTKPYVPPEENLAELTVKAVVLGVLVASLLGAANAYLGFKAGQTVSATFPAAVLAIAAFRLPFFRGTVLEQNTMRTAASVGEALVAGAIFTIPAFVMVNVDGQRLVDELQLLGDLADPARRRPAGHPLHHPAAPHAVRGRGTAVPREPRLRRDREGRPARRHRRALRVRRDGARDADPGAQGRLRDPAVPRDGRRRQGVPGLGRPPLRLEPRAARGRDAPRCHRVVDARRSRPRSSASAT